MSSSASIAVITDLSASGESLPDSIGLRIAIELATLGFSITIVASLSSEADYSAIATLLHESGLYKTMVQIGNNNALPIDEMFGANCCLVDVADISRFRFLADLPVHTWPGARLVGCLDRLGHADPRIAKEIVERLDAVAGSIDSALGVTGASTPIESLIALQTWTAATNLRLALLHESNGSIFAVSRGGIERNDPSSSGSTSATINRMVTAAAAGLAHRLTPSETLHVAATLQEHRDISGLSWPTLLSSVKQGI